MTIITNTQVISGTVGIREDLTDTIYNVSPTETPFSTAIGKTKAKAHYHEWQTDTLAAINVNNAYADGDDVTTFDSNTATVRLGNYTQILRKTGIVGGSVEAVTKAGRAKEISYRMTKASKEIKQDLESILFNNQAKSSSATRLLAAVPSWLKTNTSKGTGSAADPTAADGATARTDGTTRTFTEAMLKTVLASIFTNCGESPDYLFVSPTNKQAVSAGFNGGRTVYNKGESNKMNTAFDVYVSDFGELKVVPSRNVRTRDAFVINSDYWALAQLRPFSFETLSKTGDAEKFMLLGEVTLEARNEKASGGVFDLS